MTSVGVARGQLSPCAVTNLPTRPAPFDRQTTTGRTRPGISARPLRRRGDDADEPSNGTPVVRRLSDDDPSVHRHPRWGSTALPRGRGEHGAVADRAVVLHGLILAGARS